jgi:hypothetical protein
MMGLQKAEKSSSVLLRGRTIKNIFKDDQTVIGELNEIEKAFIVYYDMG